MDKMNVNFVNEETVVNLCDMYEVDNTQGGLHVLILDPGAPVSLTGRQWLSKFLAKFVYKIEDFNKNFPLIER